jgi:hypothetical protein
MCRGFNLDGNQLVCPGKNNIKLAITTGPVKQIHVLSDDRIETHRSVYENAETAKTNLKRMAMKMANGSSVFSPLTHTKIGDTVNFETDGMGLKHYFYRTDNILIWWQVEPDCAETTYNDLLKFDFIGLNNRGTP